MVKWLFTVWYAHNRLHTVQQCNKASLTNYFDSPRSPVIQQHTTEKPSYTACLLTTQAAVVEVAAAHSCPSLTAPHCGWQRRSDHVLGRQRQRRVQVPACRGTSQRISAALAV